MTPTTRRPTNNTRYTLQTLGFVAATAALAAACGSSSGSAASGVAAVQAPSANTTQTGAASSKSGAAAGPVTITTKSGALGTYLVDSAGKTVYLWVADKGTSSTCSGQCATYWPPVTGTATANGGAQQSDLGSSKRADGSMQVTYAGHPLYYFLLDKAPGQTNGQGNNGFGAKWWVVGADGKAITSGAPASGAGTSSGAGPKGY